MDRTIVFNGVEGYQFENDAFGNIIFLLDTVPIEQVFAAYGSRIEEFSSNSGRPGSVGCRSLVRCRNSYNKGRTRLRS